MAELPIIENLKNKENKEKEGMSVTIDKELFSGIVEIARLLKRNRSEVTNEIISSWWVEYGDRVIAELKKGEDSNVSSQ